MIGGCCAQFNRQADRASVGNLLGVDSGNQAVANSRLEKFAALLYCERAAVAETIHKFRQLFSCHTRNQFLVHELDISPTFILKFRGKGMVGEQRGYELD